MSKSSKPRRGSLQFAPRVRAKRMYSILSSKEPLNSLFGGFAGYKVGMLSVKMIENRKGSVNYGKTVVKPATVIEVPDLYILGVVSYSITPYGLKAKSYVYDINDHIKKYIKRKITISKNKLKKDISDLDYKEEDVVRVVVSTQPWKAGISKKTPEIFEVPLLGNYEENFNFIKEHLGKNYSILDVLNTNVFVDVISVTKGKGFQSSIKRFGVKLQKRGKSDKPIRRVGTLGPWHPSKTSWKVPQHGQHGFHTRTEYNKLVINVSNEVDKVARPGGWPHYGVIKSNYIVLLGSVPGAVKRLVMLRKAVRENSYNYDDIDIKKYLF